MHKVKWMIVLFACAAMARVPASAAAAKNGLMGSTMKVEYLYTNGTSNPEYTVLRKAKVNANVEIPDEQMQFAGKAWNFCVTIDVSANKIKISDIYLLWNEQESHSGRISPDQFNGFVIKFNKADMITGVTINPETTLGAATGDEPASFDQKAITFSADEITINWANAKIDDKSVLSLDVKTVTTKKAKADEADTDSDLDKDPAPDKR